MGLITSKAPKTISRRNSKRERAFTLIEILIVLAIISMVIALGLPAIERVTYQRLNSTTRKFVGLIRTIRNDAILLNNIYRLAIDLDHKAYWVEQQRAFQLLGAEDSQPVKGKKGEAPPSNFIFADKYSKKPVNMPAGIVFTGVLKEKEGFKKDGIVYIHFFPNGFNDQAILYLNKENNKNPGYSMILRPTLGRVEIFREMVSTF